MNDPIVMITSALLLRSGLMAGRSTDAPSTVDDGPLRTRSVTQACRGGADSPTPQDVICFSRSLDEPEAGVPRGLGEIAYGLVLAIRAAQPSGPYYIGGRCTKSILAFSVVQQLMRAGQELGLRELEVSDVLEGVGRAYEPGPYAGDVVLLQPAERPSVLNYRPSQTRIVMGGFAAADFPGTHWMILRQPYVQDLGAVVGACFARAQGGAPAPPVDAC